MYTHKSLQYTALSQLFRVFVLAVTASLVTACGGGSGGGSDGGTTSVSPASTATGVFLDSAVEGIAFVSGNITGVTDANGTFQYETGKAVRFMIGDIVIGETLGKSIITPVDLVSGSDASHPTVVNIVTLLLTLDDDGNPDNGIQISETVRNLALGMSINFAQTTTAFAADGNIQVAVSQLTAATNAGARSLLSSSFAQSHLSNTIWALHAGTYSGTFSGDDSGSFNVIISADGSIVGTGASNTTGTFSILGQLATDGTLTFASGGTSTGANFRGTLTTDGALSGTWQNGVESGTFSGSRTSTGGDLSPSPAPIPIGSVTFSGSVSGTLTPLAQQVSGVGDSLIVAWGDMNWRLAVTVPRNGGVSDHAELGNSSTVFSCATNFLGTTIGDCTGIAHNANARTISFDDVTVVGPAVGDSIRINGTLTY